MVLLPVSTDRLRTTVRVTKPVSVKANGNGCGRHTSIQRNRMFSKNGFDLVPLDVTVERNGHRNRLPLNGIDRAAKSRNQNTIVIPVNFANTADTVS